jgi:hypothetical protein
VKPALARIWAGPWSLVGLLFAAFFRTRRVTRGVVVCEGADWPRRMGWPFTAITFGHVVLSVPEPIPEDVLEHELVHVAQYERWGPLFVPIYLIASLWALIRGRHYYKDNPFELSARA